MDLLFSIVRWDVGRPIILAAMLAMCVSLAWLVTEHIKKKNMLNRTETWAEWYFDKVATGGVMQHVVF